MILIAHMHAFSVSRIELLKAARALNHTLLGLWKLLHNVWFQGSSGPLSL